MIRIILILSLFIAALALGDTTEEDIQKCVDNSNYSYETCAWILK